MPEHVLKNKDDSSAESWDLAREKKLREERLKAIAEEEAKKKAAAAKAEKEAAAKKDAAAAPATDKAAGEKEPEGKGGKA